MINEWCKLMKAYFNLNLTEDEESLWYDELCSAANTDNAEICKAIKWMSWKDDRDKYSGKPTLKQLRMWVFMYRKSQKEAAGLIEPEEGCGVCRHGWVDVYHDLPDEIRFADTHTAYMSCVPCLCSAGQELITNEKKCADFQKITPAEKQRLDELAARGIKQMGSIYREMSEGQPGGSVETAARQVGYAITEDARNAATERREGYRAAQERVGR